MKFHHFGQGSAEWYAARCGIPTSSCFDKIITPGGAPSKTADDYADQLVAEIITGVPADTFKGNKWTDRGIELEMEAGRYYEFQRGVKMEEVGFVTDDDYTVGASPDRLVDDIGLLEIKCPAPKNHVKYMLEQNVDKDHKPQLQGQLFVTGRQWVDIISYNPEMRPVVIRARRDAVYIAALQELLQGFNARLHIKIMTLIKSGYVEKDVFDKLAQRRAALVPAHQPQPEGDILHA